MSIDHGALQRSLLALKDVAADPDELLAALERVAEATRAVFRVEGAGLMLADDDGHLRWVTVTDERGRALEQIQEELGEGPCISAFATSTVIQVADVAADVRWPRFAVLARQHGVGSLLSVPVRAGSQPLGTLNVYAAEPHAWTGDEVRAIEAFADVVGDLLRAAIGYRARDAEVRQLEHALTTRIFIEQAKGVLVATEGLEPDAAFERLRSMARSTRRKVVDVAKEVIRNRRGLAGTEAARRRPPAERRWLAGVQAVTDAALDQLGLADLVAELLERIKAVLEADAVVILLLEGEVLRVSASLSVDRAAADAFRPPAGEGVLGRIAATGRPLLADDLPAADALSALLPASTRALAGVPMLVEGTAVGVIAVASTTPSRFRAADLKLLQMVADRAGLAIDRARRLAAGSGTQAASDRLADRLRRFQSVTAALADAATIDEIGAVVVRQGVELLDAASGLVGIVAGGQVEVVAAAGRPAGVALQEHPGRRRFPLDAPVPLAEAAREGTAIFLGSRQELRERYPAAPRGGDESIAAVALLAHGRVVGVLGLSFQEPHVIGPEERRFLFALAELCAQAVERAQLYEAAEASRTAAIAAEEQLAFLAEASAVLASAPSTEAALEQVVWLAVPRLADWASVELLDDRGSLRHLAAAHADPITGRPPAALEPPVVDAASDHPLAVALRTGQARVVGEGAEELLTLGADPEWVRLHRALAPRSAMIVPLKGKTRALGVLTLAARTPGRYGEADLALAEHLAQRIGAALDAGRWQHRGETAPSAEPGG